MYNKNDLDILILNNRTARRKTRQARLKPSSDLLGPQIAAHIAAAKQSSDQFSCSASGDESTDTEKPTLLQDADPQEAYYREIGYFPPWNDEVLGLIEAVLADPDMATGILASHKTLLHGLELDRNVSLQPNDDDKDPYADEIKALASQLPDESKESLEDRRLQKEVWKNDQEKCREDNEALFQRTIMMSMINRHRFFLTDAQLLETATISVLKSFGIVGQCQLEH